MDADTPTPTGALIMTAAVTDVAIEAITQAAGNLKREVDDETSDFIQHISEETARATKRSRGGE